jgi:sulfide dehydrogenase cytochrome subunit
MRLPLLVMLIAASLAPTVSRAQSGYANTARDLAANCANCHGTDGRAVGGMARLAGRPRAQLAQALRDFREGKRPGTVMPQLAKGYSPAQLDAIAAYLSARPQVEPPK